MLRMGVVRGISFGLFGPPLDFGPAARGLGASLVRAYVYWGQVEPEPGRFDWTVVDRLRDQVAGWGRLWITVCSSSPWATRTATAFLPPSPPRDAERYRRFVTELVRRCGAEVDYWQCENEPSNSGLLWDGSSQEYAGLLRSFAAAVREVPEAGAVVLGGIGHDVLDAEPDAEPWRFFAEVCSSADGAFDLVDVHLYGDPRDIPAHLEAVRELLDRSGCTQPLVAGEYAGPTVLGFPEAVRALEDTMMSVSGGSLPAAEPDGDEPPDRRVMRMLYQRLSDLPPELQQFLDGCPPELAARRDRIACRDLVARTLTLFAEGVPTACYWDLAPEVPGYSDPFSLIGLISARLSLLDFEDGELVDAQPAAATYRLLAGAIDGAVGVRRISLGDRPDIHAFDVSFPPGSGRALQVLWRESDAFAGDDDEREALEWQWIHPELHVANAFAEPVPLPAWVSGQVGVPLTATPVLLSATPLALRE